MDNPDVVRGKSVLDIGSGCGATAIAAKMSGALRILANDIDPSKTVIFLNILNSSIFFLQDKCLQLLQHHKPFPCCIS